MALTRKMLKAMGIEEEKIDQIIEAHTETVENLKEEVNKNEEAAKGYAAVQKELDKAKAEIEAMKNDNFKSKYDTVKKEFDDYKKEIQNKELQENKVKAYREILKDGNLSDKGIEKAVKYADWNAIELEDGKIKDAAKHIKAAQEEWAEHVVKTNTRGANPASPPSNVGGAMSKEDIMAIKDRTERRAAIAKNLELFNGGNE